MEYTYIVANMQNNGGWNVALRDGDKVIGVATVQNRLHNYLKALSEEGWEVLAIAATERTLTIILGKR